MPTIITDRVHIDCYGSVDLQAQLFTILEAHGFNLETLNDKPYQTKKGKIGQYRKLKITRNA